MVAGSSPAPAGARRAGPAHTHTRTRTQTRGGEGREGKEKRGGGYTRRRTLRQAAAASTDATRPPVLKLRCRRGVPLEGPAAAVRRPAGRRTAPTTHALRVWWQAPPRVAWSPARRPFNRAVSAPGGGRTSCFWHRMSVYPKTANVNTNNYANACCQSQSRAGMWKTSQWRAPLFASSPRDQLTRLRGVRCVIVGSQSTIAVSDDGNFISVPSRPIFVRSCDTTYLVVHCLTVGGGGGGAPA